MFRHTIPIGRVLGIPIDLDYSWFLICVLLTWLLSAVYYPQELAGLGAGQYWSMGAVTTLLFFASLVVHELAHSWVALRYRIPVRRITLFIFGGVSQIVGEPPSAGAELLIAGVGPLASFALAVLFRLLAPAVAGSPPLLAVVSYLAIINLTLGIFNLIPGFPLDGGRILRALVWGTTGSFRRATVIAAHTGRFFGYLFIAAGAVLAVRGNVLNGLWIAFIGWFLESAAAAQVQQQLMQSLLVGHKVDEVMGEECARVDAGTSLHDIVEHQVLAHGRRCFLVERLGAVAGLLTLHDIKVVPRPSWDTVPAAQAMRPLDRLQRIDAGAELWTAMEQMGREGANQLPVMRGGQLVGVLSRGDVIRYLHVLQQLKA